MGDGDEVMISFQDLSACPWPFLSVLHIELMQQEVASMSPSVDAFAEEYLDYIRATYNIPIIYSGKIK